MTTEINIVAYFVAFIVGLPNGMMAHKNIILRNYVHPFIWLREEIEKNPNANMSILFYDRLTPEQLRDIEAAWATPLPKKNIIDLPPSASLN